MIDNVNKVLATGRIIDGKWVILEFLGRGGMGEVYMAHQFNLDRRVAIKVISTQWIKSLEGDSGAINSSLERFRREVQVMAQVQHPNVLQILDYGSLSPEEGGDRTIEYIVMEYAPGGSLRSTMSNEGFHPEEDRTRNWLSRYFLPLLEGVKALHDAGTIHRDLKPENVLLCEDIPKIADFGLARSFHFKPITQSVEIQGTPFYMSPEHFLDLKRTDERTDIYALGKILYEAISGKSNPEQIPFKMAALAHTQIPFFEKLDHVIRNATAEKRADRFPTVQALIDALGQIIREDDCTVLPPLPESRAERNSHWRLLLFTVALVLFTGVATALGTYFHERGQNLRTKIDARISNMIQYPPQQGAGPEEHSSAADRVSTPYPDSGISTPSHQAPSEGLGQANLNGDETSASAHNPKKESVEARPGEHPQLSRSLPKVGSQRGTKSFSGFPWRSPQPEPDTPGNSGGAGGC